MDKKYASCLITLLLSLSLLTVTSRARAVEVFAGHPRLFFRDSAWGERSITTEQLRQRAHDSRYASYVNRLSYSPCNVALKALLLDDSAAAAECVSMLKTDFEFDGTTTDGELVMWAAMAFDWLYPRGDFSDTDKANVVSRLATGADWLIGQYEGQGAHIFHTRMYGFAVGVGMAGLALKGHHASADRYIQWADSIFTKHLFPARRLQAGSVHNGFGYGRRYTMWHSGHFMSAWYSATGDDKWKTVREEQDDWAWREAEFIIYSRQPDSLLVRFADCFRRTSERYSFRVIGERAFAYAEPVGREYLNYLFATQAVQPDNRVVEEGNAYNVLLWWDPDAPGVSHTTLPRRTLFSPRGTGMAFWRSGWGENDTFIFFKCGNYFEDHGHFDQGHLEVFRHKPLLIESGAYEGDFESSFRLNYYRKTIAHNSILAVNPVFSQDEGGQRIYSNQSLATLESYLADPGSETGEIVDYRDSGYWSYVAGDFSKAYYPSVIETAVREVAWIAERYLVVVDNIKLANSALLPKVLWHYTVRPLLEPGRFTVSDGGGRAVVTVLSPAGATLDTVRAYQIGTAYYPPPDPRPELGVGRVEVSVAQSGATDYTFVEVIDVADEGVKAGEVSLEQDQATGPLKVLLPPGTLSLQGDPKKRSLVSFTARTLEPPGDYDGSGNLDLEDLIRLLRLALEDSAQPLADFNGDGRYSITDAVALLIRIRSTAPGGI